MIYLDNNSTAPVLPEVIDYLKGLFFSSFQYGNPSSIHSFGRKSKNLVREASEIIKSFFKVPSYNVIYTSGATESLNLALHTLPKGHIITSSIEHPSVYEFLKILPNPISYLEPKDNHYVITLEQIKDVYREDTIAIVLASVNSETGAKIDLESISSWAFNKNLIFIVDGVASVGKEKPFIPEGVTAFCFSGHKIHSPPGIGVLLAKPSFNIKPFFYGGGQQNGKRSGTENLWGIAGLAHLIKIITKDLDNKINEMKSKRDLFETSLLSLLPKIVIHAYSHARISNVSSILFPGIEGEILCSALDLEGVAIGYGSACSSGALSAPRSLLHLGKEIASSSLRFSLSRLTTEEDILTAVNIIFKVVKKFNFL